jgi:serine protease Do
MRTLGLTKPEGALIAQVFEGSPAQAAGLQAGDLILSLNGHPIVKGNDLPILVAQSEIGTTVSMEAQRKGERKNFQVKIAPQENIRPAVATSTIGAGNLSKLGLEVRDINPVESQRNGIPPGQGVTVTGIEDSSAAANVGIQPGDVILQLNDRPVGGSREFMKQSQGLNQGQLVRMLVKRGPMTSFFAFKI